MRLIDGDELYKAMKDAEDLARQRVLDTESTLPYPNNLNPSYTRYLAQMDERTKAKHMIADAPTVDAVSVRHGKWVDENGNRPYGYRFNWLCSECGRPQHTSTAKLLKEFEEEHRWCHFCGARMDGKGDGNG